MGLFDDIGKYASDTWSAITSSSDQKEEIDNNGKLTINTLDGMSSWLQKLQTDQTSPSAMQALQSQMQVLNFVKSPTLTGMAVDTMIMCLYKAIQSSTNETEREAVRESFALMIQSFMFFNEAQLQYEINSNKEEGIQLLSQAGDILSKSVVSVATLVASGGAAAPQIANVVVGNVFGQQNEQQSFFGKIVSYIGEKERIEERKVQHIDSLNNAFTTFDRYASMIGPSIVLHGMLERYGKQLIENFEEQKTKYIIDKVLPNLEIPGLKESDTMSDVIDTTLTILTFGILQSSDKEKEIKKNLSARDYILLLRDKVSERLSDCKRTLTNDKKDLAQKKQEYDNMSTIMLQAKNGLNKKFEVVSASMIKAGSELNAEIESLESSIRENEKKVASAKKDLAQVDSLIEKLNELKPEIDAYTAKINATIEKFAFDFSNVITQ